MLNNSKKRKVLLLSLVAILIVCAGTTIAYFTQQTDEVVNTFNPTAVTCEVTEDFENNVKTNVAVKNTGDIDAYIRADVVVTWQDQQGNVYGKKPVAGEDYTITYNLSNEGWVYNEADGFYYYKEKVGYVAPDNVTDVLITECAPTTDAAPAGYYLSVEILASAIQADGVSDGVGEPGTIENETAIHNAWGVDLSALVNQQ